MAKSAREYKEEDKGEEGSKKTREALVSISTLLEKTRKKGSLIVPSQEGFVVWS
jgi:hypothetical protein